MPLLGISKPGSVSGFGMVSSWAKNGDLTSLLKTETGKKVDRDQIVSKFQAQGPYGSLTARRRYGRSHPE